MKLSAALMLLALTAPALAQEAGEERIETDTNLICETQQQVERFVALFNPDAGSAEDAIAKVNAESDAPEACLIATIAYRRADQVATVRNADASFDVVRIVVVGVHTVHGFEDSVPTEFFTLLPDDEEMGTVGQR
jgi:hypothetical protein